MAFAAAAIPNSASFCITASHFFFPSLRLRSQCCFRRRVFTLINNHRRSRIPCGSKSTHLLPPSLSPCVSNSTRFPLSCYCTVNEMQNTVESTLGGDDIDSDVRKAANALDLRVGKILKAWRHEEADTLYVEEVDIGEPEPRTICSGLVKYIPLHLLQDKNVIVLANLKPRNMRGVKSFGMLMAASDATHENVELLVPPAGAVPGERVWFGSADEKDYPPQIEIASPNQVQKKKIWELVQPHLKTDDSCVAMLGMGHQMRTAAGVVTCESLKNAKIS
ncbi:uncharacterized protein LOC127245282 isoform X2 [Andrographis paniculata]|uniref:uncharacterized protein LOC127245282 isoform X1 n=1 Tax=Andrographis paniculata TaxID=175694 RepID=UPI0021E8CC1F|nr:uncharacterized protein LOC127245282 isoform X1 [Andrographis paniculata]XP_051122025.1 uncharacterized protein LOC127245282 isoform X2 [Andrographis paniculata]